MRFSCVASLLLLLSSCSPKEEEEIDYDHMVMLEEEADWTTGQEDPMIAGELSPEPQEALIVEVPEISSAVR